MMLTMQVKNSVTLHKIKPEKVTKKLHSNMSRLWDDAARAYLRAIALNDIIHVDTGMSKASLLPLARYLKMYTAVKATIRPKVSSRRGVFNIKGIYNPNGERSFSAGESSSSLKAGYNILYGSHKRMRFVFEFEIRVWQYLINEHGFGKLEAWNTLEIGRNAFINFIDSNWSEYVSTDPRKWGLL